MRTLRNKFLGAMIAGMADHYFFNLKFPHSVVLFWIYAALGMVAMRLANTGEPRKKETSD